MAGNISKTSTTIADSYNKYAVTTTIKLTDPTGPTGPFIPMHLPGYQSDETEETFENETTAVSPFMHMRDIKSMVCPVCACDIDVAFNISPDATAPTGTYMFSGYVFRIVNKPCECPNVVFLPQDNRY